MKMEMAREIEVMGIKICCRWVCLLWVTLGKLVGSGVATTSWWVGSSPATSRVASRPSLGLGVAANHPLAKGWPAQFWGGSLATPWVARVVKHHPTWPTEREMASGSSFDVGYGGS